MAVTAKINPQTKMIVANPCDMAIPLARTAPR